MYALALLAGLTAAAPNTAVRDVAQPAPSSCSVRLMHVATTAAIGGCPQFLATTRMARQSLRGRT